jgi:hypothetical protein
MTIAQWKSSCSDRTDRQKHKTKIIVALLNFAKKKKNPISTEDQ